MLVPLQCGVETDAKKSDEHILGIGQSGLGLPDRDYYRDAKFKAKLAAYRAYLERMLTLAKIHCDAKLGCGQYRGLGNRDRQGPNGPRCENRDADKTYNKMGLAELGRVDSGLRLGALFPRESA